MNGHQQNSRGSLDDQLRIENEIIKMKLMLEHGAKFSSGQGSDMMDPALEHAFLKHVLAMEEAQKNGNSLTVFQKLGCPTDIPASEDLAEDEFPQALQQLQKRLSAHGIQVRPVEKDIAPEEFYRFLSKELMEVKVHDIPNVHCFLFESVQGQDGCRLERIAQEEGLQNVIAGQAPLGEISKNKPLRLNGFEHHDRTSVQHRLMRFRMPYQDVLGLNKKITRTILEKDSCTVYGTHDTALCMKDHCEMVHGEWYVTFQRSESDEWHIAEIDIDGLRI